MMRVMVTVTRTSCGAVHTPGPVPSSEGPVPVRRSGRGCGRPDGGERVVARGENTADLDLPGAAGASTTGADAGARSPGRGVGGTTCVNGGVGQRTAGTCSLPHVIQQVTGWEPFVAREPRISRPPPFPHAHHSRDLLVAQFVQLSEDPADALVVGQVPEHPGQGGGRRGGLRAAGWFAGRVVGRGLGDGVQRDGRRPPVQEVEAAIGDDAVHPRVEGGVAPEAGEVSPCTGECFLDDLLGEHGPRRRLR